MSYEYLLAYELFNNTIKEYLIAILVLIIGVYVLKFFKYTIVKRLNKLFKKTKTDVDDLAVNMIDAFGWPLYFFLSLFVAIQFLYVPEYFSTALKYILLILATYYAVLAVQKSIEYGTNKIVNKKGADAGDASTVKALSGLLKGVLWVIAAVLLLSNLGYDVSTLIAGLGIGGLAVAFALQNVLSDIFASISIYLDKPFQVGDYIVLGTDGGTVKKIGIKTTRITTLQGEELIVSNKELTETRVNNYKKLKKRRVVFMLGATYETSTTKLKKIPKLIKDIITKQKGATFDRTHFKEFADSSLNFEIVYYVNSSKYLDFMDVQHKLNLAIKQAFEKEKIEFAYPTRTIYNKK